MKFSPSLPPSLPLSPSSLPLSLPLSPPSPPSPQNAAIARESLELLTTCLKLRSSLLNAFYTLPQVEEFVSDILTGCPHPDVRLSMATQLNQLCRDLDTGTCACPSNEE